MIFSRPTKYGAGIQIYGDYHDLDNLHETIHQLANDQGPLNGSQMEFVLGLAYEVRHAYQGDRETHRFAADITHKETTIYYSFQSLWPIFLPQLGLLRWAAGFQPTNREQQANLYRLEACAESALKAYDPFIGKRCLEWLSAFHGLPDDYLLQHIEDCARQYVSGKKVGKARFKELPDILLKLSPLSPEYQKFEEYLQKVAQEQNCQAAELSDRGEYPKFKW